MIKQLTCIGCPMGCCLKVQLNNGNFFGVSGNKCKKGAEYAKSEITNPTRILTSTVMTDDGVPVSVKTATPIPKDRIFDCMQLINNIVIHHPVKINDIAAKNVFGSNIIVTTELQ